MDKSGWYHAPSSCLEQGYQFMGDLGQLDCAMILDVAWDNNYGTTYVPHNLRK